MRPIPDDRYPEAGPLALDAEGIPATTWEGRP
jgi:hypothetical protein